MAQGSGIVAGFTGLAIDGASVTPMDGTAQNYNALYVGSGGSLAVTLRDSSASVTFVNVGDGEFLPLRVKYILSTGTTATNIIGLQTL